MGKPKRNFPDEQAEDKYAGQYHQFLPNDRTLHQGTTTTFTTAVPLANATASTGHQPVKLEDYNVLLTTVSRLLTQIHESRSQTVLCQLASRIEKYDLVVGARLS